MEMLRDFVPQHDFGITFASIPRGMKWIETSFTAAIAVLSFCFLYSLSRLYLHQHTWVKTYFREKNAQEHLYHALPHLLNQISSFLKAGYTLPHILKQLAETKEGSLFASALKAKKSHPPHLHCFLQFLKISMTLARKNGTPLSDIFTRISELIRHEIRFQEKIKILTYPIKTEAAVALLLPWGIILIFGLMEPSLLRNTLIRPAGVAGFSSAALLELLALLWIQRILR